MNATRNLFLAHESPHKIQCGFLRLILRTKLWALGGAIAVGMIGGTLSVVGYNIIQPKFVGKFIHDSCGINNLHGMPSIAGALVSVVVAAYTDKSDYSPSDYEAAFPA